MTRTKSAKVSLFVWLAWAGISQAQNTTQTLRDEIFRRGVASDPDVPGQDGHGLGEVLSGSVNLEADGLLPLPAVEITRGALDAVSGVRETSHQIEVQLFQGLYLVTHRVRLESRAPRASEVIWKTPVVATATALARVELCAWVGEVCDPARRTAHSAMDAEFGSAAHYAQYIRSIARSESSATTNELGPAMLAELESGELRVRVAPIGQAPVELAVTYVATAELVDGRYRLSIPARVPDPRLSEIEFSFVSDEAVDLRFNDIAIERENNAWHTAASPERAIEVEVREPRTFRTTLRSTTVAISGRRNIRHSWLLAARCAENCEPPASIGIVVDLSASMQNSFAGVESLLRKLEQHWHRYPTLRIDVLLFATRTVVLTFHADQSWVDGIRRHQGTLGYTTDIWVVQQMLARNAGLRWFVFSDEVLRGSWPPNASFVFPNANGEVSRANTTTFVVDTGLDAERISERLFAPTLARSPRTRETDQVRAGTGLITGGEPWSGAAREQITIRNRDAPLGLAIVANARRLQSIVAVPLPERRDPCASGSLALAPDLHRQSILPRGPLALAQAVFSCRDSRARATPPARATPLAQASRIDPEATGLAMDAARNLLRQQALAAIRSCLRDDRRGRTRFSRRFVLRFQLRRREVENFRIEGSLPETLSTCLANAVTEVAVPEFEQTLDIRWPLYTEAAPEAERATPLESELDAQVRAIGVDLPRDARLLTP